MVNVKAVLIIIIIASAVGTGIFLGIWLTADKAPILKEKLECAFTAQTEGAIGKCFTSNADCKFYLINDTRTHYGDFVNVTVSPSPNVNGYYEFNVTFEWCTASGLANLDAWSRKINYFSLGYPYYYQSYIQSLSFESLYAAFEGLPSNGSLLVARDDVILHTYNAAQRMAVASTFKLYVIQALNTKINDEPGINWSMMYPVQDKYKSLDSGGIISYPNGTLLTLKDYSDSIIHRSDNSATDHMIHFLGRTYVESFLPATYDFPLLTTAELFKLRYLISDSQLDAYLLMTEPNKRNYLDTTLAALDVNDINLYQNWLANIDVERYVEWYFTITEIYQVQNLTKTNPSNNQNWGLAWIGMTWTQVSYKGGNTDGVYSMAHALQAANSSWYYVTFIANNFDEFKIDCGHSVYGQIGYEAICMKIMYKLSLL